MCLFWVCPTLTEQHRSYICRKLDLRLTQFMSNLHQSQDAKRFQMQHSFHFSHTDFKNFKTRQTFTPDDELRAS